ncbi:RrF2 family transcriptional regulator [Tateyamaria sp.]|uniref:RrF2 family transcriptional regulator n=1 Tax=Tateyamaria sp. TaxID=1929288 RepID=UPI0032A0DF68
MQLSTFTDYALRMLMHLAVAQDRKLTTRQITDMHGAKFNHLTKVTQWLVREGYVTATRGRSGGLQLRRDPAKINIGKVIRALESQHRLVECLREDGGTCILAPACELTTALLEAQDAFFHVLDGKTLSQLTANNRKITPLLHRLNTA